uniref:Probable membrane-associated kinase regulator 4 n=2 Tax=Nicotiana TaxID=4085 RepID=A0A1S3X4M3_TOBAC|nr:PREDICTED: probable membrane-associated kinase regulator 4 [Nicotiana sylvestris]XP_016434874.1 PREDICTED: probable membrane-associated kinase regulator 4 [Nicotiana tabacum]
MATNPPLSDEEDYIDIEVNSYYSYFSCPSTISSPQNREFEFQLASIINDKKTTTSPADEVFFKGKLLPLHQKILPPYSFKEDEEESFCINFLITSTNNSPIRSSNISCRVSFELNPNEWFSTELTTSSINDNNNSPKKLWSKKFKLMSQKIKASREFLKSLFSKYSCKKTPLKNNGILCGASPTLASTIKNINRADEDNNVNNNYSSRSFSAAAEIKWNSPTKSLSSSCGGSTSFSSSYCSFNSNNDDLSLLKRSNSFTSQMGSIEAAIAYCKKS